MKNSIRKREYGAFLTALKEQIGSARKKAYQTVNRQMEFPDMRGLSAQNLWRMKQIYEVYRDYPILSPLARELPWTHNTVILHGTQSIEEKEFYLKAALSERLLWQPRRLPMSKH